MSVLQTNVLYFSDNLDTVRRYGSDASVDLICLDPPCKRTATATSCFTAPPATAAIRGWCST